jgi:hypothetical protein
LDRGVENTIIWSTVLPLIGSAARGLTTLILLQADFLPEVDILDFIAQLPLLRHLTISCRNKPDIRLKNSPPTPLRDLETLRAPSPYVHYLLRSPSCLPKIQSICILWPEIYVNAITAIGAALSALSTILDAHGRAPRLVVSVTTIYHSAILANPIDALRAFLDRVEVLEIAATPFLSSDITNMAHCIRLFPRVRHVEIAIPTVHQFRQDLARLLRAVKSTQYLKQIEVNGETYNLVHG